MTVRRINNIISHYNTSVKNAQKWANNLNDTTGTWPNINYLSGCDARVANWPAVGHLAKTLTVSIGYIKDKQDQLLLSKSHLALNYWLDHDFTEPDCVDRGGKKGSNCPCGTPGLWNRNWFDQEIGVPRLIGSICLVMMEELSESQIEKCNIIMSRAYERATRKPTNLTGANLLDVASIGISMGLLNRDSALLINALGIFYSGVKITDTLSGDGIQSDGSFMQHLGLLYNGNYGKDYINDLLSVFIETKNTNLMPSLDAQNAFETLLEGSEWMMIANTKLSKLLWQYSAIGRMVSFRYSDKQASGGIGINMNSVLDGIQGWESQENISRIANRLNGPISGVNQGELIGTRYFYNSDYLVHRTRSYVVTMKMYSSRTFNSECLNVQNPFGFHMSDGAIFNYLNGDEYRDIFAAWNWELVPGVTTDIGGTLLKCSKVKTKGKKSFVGGATDGNTGIVVFDYLNPINGHLSFKKTAFFFPSAYAIQIDQAKSINDSSPIVTVLDQRRRNGDFFINGQSEYASTFSQTQNVTSVWHDSTGYYFPKKQSVRIESVEKPSNWSSIGISQGYEKENLWTSYIEHQDASLIEYIVQPGILQDEFDSRQHLPIVLDSNTPQIYSAYSQQDETISIAFWSPGVYKVPWKSLSVSSDSPCVLIWTHVEKKIFRLTVADPSQQLHKINLTIELDQSISVSRTFDISSGTQAGKAMVQSIDFDAL
ncbi:hypothetical protein G6F56_000243 [Rhizopus delemar]|uniref:Uncharacterized protein n=1 Tax=Rhizopus stolonifer TaxID=4846 RepID=A0A367KVC0_RHIST|nr:hypothetical protein G6F56_000243 [Rhizopus delemar]RCI06146.1 hypothetical protein CU098_013162 [Rhizopus stolonifer]